ncbi:DNA polymerase III subunit delta' [Qipengyuania spongiae]|uniref:DNA polymerase III subunit delta n=1 Tax=Qipengyuania spongiae TaxID=2909673 RepID=A0ABY5T0N2_9SPHN|nr:DNA polymerase III subunit delta' [Qipengyuania spongiae]UVI38881.1 DNA polymerase III subunit delta' [Qipengyuania spongiae]
MTLIGHEAPRSAWQSALSSERMHHAWLLAGKAGLGKMRFALEAARELVGAATSQAEHPDIVLLTYGAKDDKEDRKRADGKPFELARSIRIDQVRAMQRKLNTRPSMGERRAVIIDPADDMERNAANALLKSLEEPPVGTTFLLVSHRPAKLLPTIRSRCRLLRFPALADSQVEALLAEKAPSVDVEARWAAVRAGAGSPGAALAFIDQDLGPLASLIGQILREGDPSFVLRGKLAGAIGSRPDRERLRATLELARAALADDIEQCPRTALPERIAAHDALVRLTGEMPTYNYDPGLMVMEVGTLLARAGAASERADG